MIFRFPVSTLFLSVAATTVTAQDYALFPDIDLYSFDMGATYSPLGTSLEAATQNCERDCNNRDGCMSFTVVAENYFHNGSKPKCHLKHSVPLPTKKPQRVGTITSGIRAGYPTVNYKLLTGTDLYSNDMGATFYPSGTSLEIATKKCAEDCDNRNGCVSFTVVAESFFYNGSKPKCHLKHTVSSETRKPEYAGKMVSGIFAPPTSPPTSSPTVSPTVSPTANPTVSPTMSPTANPTASPTMSPTANPTASPTASPTVSPTSSFSMMPDADLYSYDMGATFYALGTSLERASKLCAKDCLAHNGCIAFTVVAESFFGNNSRPKCHLKHSVPAPTFTPEWAGTIVSGVLKGHPTTQFTMLADADLYSYDMTPTYYELGTSWVKAQEMCAEDCLGRNGCVGFTVVKENFFSSGSRSKCHLKRHVPEPTPRPQWSGKIVSGVLDDL